METVRVSEPKDRSILWLASLLPLVAILAPFLVPYSPFGSNLDQRLLAPNGLHWLGTDELGRDVFSRLIFGSRVSLWAALLATLLALALGLAVGGVAGFSRGAVRRIAVSVIEIVQTVPGLVLAISAATFFSPSTVSSAVIIGFTAWVDLARATSASVRSAKESPFVSQAEASGASHTWIARRHLLPAALWPAFAFAPYILGGAIVTEASLSFLGLGTPPPAPSWGRALADARSLLPGAWWCAAPPAIAIFGVVLFARRLGARLRESVGLQLSLSARRD
jgi:peptide/nickel transport system permease protein